MASDSIFNQAAQSTVNPPVDQRDPSKALWYNPELVFPDPTERLPSEEQPTDIPGTLRPPKRKLLPSLDPEQMDPGFRVEVPDQPFDIDPGFTPNVPDVPYNIDPGFNPKAPRAPGIEIVPGDEPGVVTPLPERIIIPSGMNPESPSSPPATILPEQVFGPFHGNEIPPEFLAGDDKPLDEKTQQRWQECVSELHGGTEPTGGLTTGREETMLPC